jgi:hypothetical protein
MIFSPFFLIWGTILVCLDPDPSEYGSNPDPFESGSNPDPKSETMLTVPDYRYLTNLDLVVQGGHMLL